jgi:hypothetical protein
MLIPSPSYRYFAACVAVRVGTGKEGDAADLDAETRAAWRRLGYDWLRADLTLWRQRLRGNQPAVRAEAARLMRHWLTNPDLADVRDPEALRRLPAAERKIWDDLWDEVRRTADEADRRPG